MLRFWKITIYVYAIGQIDFRPYNVCIRGLDILLRNTLYIVDRAGTFSVFN